MTMMKLAIKIALSVLLASLSANWTHAQSVEPLYIVNGHALDSISMIPPADIEYVEYLPATDENIQKYGDRASNGVMLVSLKYDQPATFAADSLGFAAYISSNIEWSSDEPAARLVMRYTVSKDGEVILGETLESTDYRLKRRALKAIEQSPKWTPASKEGVNVSCERVLRIELPVGKSIPKDFELVIR